MQLQGTPLWLWIVVALVAVSCVARLHAQMMPTSSECAHVKSNYKPLRRFDVFGAKMQNECGKIMRMLQEKDVLIKKQMELVREQSQARKLQNALQTADANGQNKNLLSFMRDFYGPRYLR